MSIYSLLHLTYRSSAFCKQLSSMPLCYAYLAQLLCLPSLLCLLLSSMPTQSPTPLSACTESVCIVFLPSVLPNLLSTVPSDVFMQSTYFIVSYDYLVCYDYMLVMPTHAVSIAYLVIYGLLAMLARFPLPALSSIPTYAWYAVPMCLSSHLCLILVLQYSLLYFGSVQHFMFTLMFSYAM